MMAKNEILIIWVFLLLFSAVLNAQVIDVQDTVMSLRPIPITEVPQFTERTNQLGLEVQRLLAPPPAIQAIKNELPANIEIIELKKASLLDSTQSFNLSQLESFKRDWDDIQDRISKWNQLITDRVQRLQNKKTEVQNTIETWKLTYQLAQELQAPPEMLETIFTGSRLLTNHQADLQVALSDLLKLQTELAPIFNTISDIQNFIKDHRNIIIEQIWTPESPPLWNLGADTTDFSLNQHLSLVYNENIAVASAYWKSKASFRYFIIFIFLLIYINLIYFKVTAKKLMDNYPQDIADVQLILKYPFFSAMILTWVFLALFFDAPREMKKVLAMIMITPVSVILYSLSKIQKTPKTLAFIFLVLVFHMVPLLTGTLSGRFFLLIIGIALLVIMVLLLRKNENLEIISTTQPGLVRFIIQVLIILNFGSLAANILGSVQLSELLFLGIVGSILISIIFYQAIFLITDIISLIMVGSPLNKSNIVRNYRPLIRKRFKTAFTILAIIWGGYLILGQFNIHQAVVNWVITFVTASVEVGEVSISLADILAFYLSIQLSIWISKFLRFIIEEEVYQRTKTGDKGVSGTISLMVRYTVISLGVVLAFAAAGIEFSKIAILVGALGVGIGFGLQSIFNNLVSGLILALERPIQVGDVVEVTDLMGVVKEIGFRASRIRTYDGAEVIVPNGDLVSSQVINWTLSDTKRRLKVDIVIARGTDPKTVLKALQEAADAHPDILKNPAPIPRFMGFGDSGLNFQLLFWIPDFDQSFRMGTEVTTLVHDHLKSAGIKIPFPQRDIHVKEIEGELKPPAKNPKPGKPKK